MKREHSEYRQPYACGDYELRRGAEGTYWQAHSGLTVRLAAPEGQFQGRGRGLEPHVDEAALARAAG